MLNSNGGETSKHHALRAFISSLVRRTKKRDLRPIDDIEI